MYKAHTYIMLSLKRQGHKYNITLLNLGIDKNKEIVKIQDLHFTSAHKKK